MALPVLNSVINAIQTDPPDLRKIVFVCVQHLLYTSIDIFKGLIKLGAQPQNIFLLGKQYSNCPTVINKALALGLQVQKSTPLQKLGGYESIMNHDITNMWESVREYVNNNARQIDAVVILDDGGRCVKMFPKDLARSLPAVAVEQTTAGIVQLNHLNLPISYIDVATSAAKSLEADMVAGVLLNKISNRLPDPKERFSCGVVGLGFIGSSVAKKLMSLGYNVILYDSNNKISKPLKSNTPSELLNFERKRDNVTEIRKVAPKICWDKSGSNFKNEQHSQGKIEFADSLESLIRNSDYIFGCTGNDFANTLDLAEDIQGHKYFISCTSEDKEFLSILRFIDKESSKTNWHPLGDINWKMNKNTMIHLIKGGFPCNFDYSGKSVPANDIQLTRALIFGGLIQAIISLPSYRRNAIRTRIMLDPDIQKFVVLQWDQFKNRNINTVNLVNNTNKFWNNNWIMQNSGGILHSLSCFPNYFNIEQDKYRSHFN